MSKLDELISKRPPQATWGVNLYYASLVLGLVQGLVFKTGDQDQVPIHFIIFILVLTLGIVGFVVYKVSQGRKWARTVMAVLFGIGIAVTLANPAAMFSQGAAAFATALIQWSMQAAALVLLFMPASNAWFFEVGTGLKARSLEKAYKRAAKRKNRPKS